MSQKEVKETIKSLTNPEILPQKRKRGGVQPGAGRPKKDTAIARAREQVIKTIYKNKEDLLKAQIDAAKGLSYVHDDGKHIYVKKPDTAAGEYLLNQLIGKPKESVEVRTVNLNVDI